MKLTGKKKTTVEPNAAVALRVAGQLAILAAVALTALATRQDREAQKGV